MLQNSTQEEKLSYEQSGNTGESRLSRHTASEGVHEDHRSESDQPLR